MRITPTVLIVEDDRDTRGIIKHSLVALGYDIVEAEDGDVAQECCKKSVPDLIVTDVMMPRLSGTEFVIWFRQNFKQSYVPILMLTALAEVEQKVIGLNAGADDYLAKPFNYRELQARVQSLFRTKDLTDSLLRKTVELEATNLRLAEVQNELIAKEREVVAMQLAGAAAHNIAQPITAILLNCRVIEQGLEGYSEPALEKVLLALKAIQNECAIVSTMIGKLQVVDPSKVTEYLGDMTILDIEK